MPKKKTHEQFVLEMYEVNPNIEILGKYVDAKTKILCRCKIHMCEWMLDPSHLLGGQGCPICGKESYAKHRKKKTHEQFVADCNKSVPTIKIRGRYTGVLDDIECECTICGAIYNQVARKLMEGIACPICSGRRIYVGINDIATTNPDIVKYFKDKEDAYKYTRGSTKFIIFKCPICGYEKKCKISDVVANGYFSCPKCSDGISYPNKFSREFLNQLPVTNIEYEYHPEWAHPYFYDNYFEYNNKKYILEMDGAFHYMKYYNSNLDLDDTKRIDKIKDNLAIDHGIEIIRINCFYSTKEFIKNNILESELSKIFNLDNIDWNKCDKNAVSSLVVRVCEYYNNNNKPTVTEIAKVFDIQICTVSKYLYKGNDIGICNYRPCNKIPVMIKENDEFITFDTMNDCKRYLIGKYDNITDSQMSWVFRKKKTEYKNIQFKYL